MALRDALVIDKWRRYAPPDKRRRRAVARLLYVTYSIISPNITQPNEKTTVRERSRLAKPLSAGSAFPRTQKVFFHRISFSGIRFFVVTVYRGFMSAEYGFAPWSPRILSERTWFFPISSHSFFQTVML